MILGFVQGKFLDDMIQMYLSTAKVMLPNIEEKPGQGYNTVTLMFDHSPRTDSINAYISTPSRSVNIRRMPLYNIPKASILDWVRQDISTKGKLSLIYQCEYCMLG